MTQTDLATNITAIFSKLDDVVKTLTATITDNDAKFDETSGEKLQPLALQAKYNSEILNKQNILMSSIKSYYEFLDKMSIKNIIKFDTARNENKELLKKNFGSFKAESFSSMNMKTSALDLYKYPYSYYQPSDYLVKWPLLMSPYLHSHSSQFTKHLSFITLEGNTLIKTQKW